MLSPSRAFCFIFASPAPFSSCRWADWHRISFVACRLASWSGRDELEGLGRQLLRSRFGVSGMGDEYTDIFLSIRESFDSISMPSLLFPNLSISFLHIRHSLAYKGSSLAAPSQPGKHKHFDLSHQQGWSPDHWENSTEVLMPGTVNPGFVS